MNRALFLFAAVALAGCGGSSSKSVEPNLSFPVDLTSVDTSLRSINSDSGIAGWNRLQGTTTLDGQSCDLDMQATVTYRNGSGPFFGLVTLTRPDNSSLVMRMDGEAFKNASSGDTSFTSQLLVLGGTGTYANATGRGTFTGSRSGVLGSPVQLKFEISLDGK